jgi:hypothetical protein
MRPDAAQLLAAIDHKLDDLRHVSYQDVSCLVLNPETVPNLFENRYACEQWCAKREMRLVLSLVLPEGEYYLGNKEVLDNGDDAIREMQKEIDQLRERSDEFRRERSALLSQRGKRFDAEGRLVQ